MSAGRRGGGGGTILRAAVSQCNRGRSSIQEFLREAEEGKGEDTDQGIQRIVVRMLVQRHLHQSRPLQPSPFNAALCGASGECECVPVQGGPEVCARAGVHKLTTVLHCAVTVFAQGTLMVFAQGWAVNTNDKDWDLYWSDTDSVFRCTQPHFPHDNAAHHPICCRKQFRFNRVQKTNHFPGMVDICRKDFLAFNLNKMRCALRANYRANG